MLALNAKCEVRIADYYLLQADKPNWPNTFVSTPAIRSR